MSKKNLGGMTRKGAGGSQAKGSLLVHRYLSMVGMAMQPTSECGCHDQRPERDPAFRSPPPWSYPGGVTLYHNTMVTKRHTMQRGSNHEHRTAAVLMEEQSNRPHKTCQFQMVRKSNATVFIRQSFSYQSSSVYLHFSWNIINQLKKCSKRIHMKH